MRLAICRCLKESDQLLIDLLLVSFLGAKDYRDNVHGNLQASTPVFNPQRACARRL